MNTTILVGTAALVVSLAVTFIFIWFVLILGKPAPGQKRATFHQTVIVLIVVAVLALISLGLGGVPGVIGALSGCAIAAGVIFIPLLR